MNEKHIADVSKMDLIRRTDALFILYDFAGCIVDTPGGHYRKAYEAYRRKLETLPAIQPKRGRWITRNDNWGMYYECSKCGGILTRINCFEREFSVVPSYNSIAKTNFCPSCGADMSEGGKDALN